MSPNNTRDKIIKIEIFKFNIPLKTPFRIAFETITHAENILIKIHTNSEICGWGECSPYKSIIGETQAGEFEIAPLLAKSILGKSPLEIENRLLDLDLAITANPCIKSAFDIALHDIAAQSAGMPLYAYLGGANDRILHTDMTIGLDTPENMAQQAREFLAAGFPAIKVKVGTTLEADLARIKAIREVVGSNLPLRIDANQGWSPTNALQILKAMESYNIEHCEAPISKKHRKALINLNRESPIPIMADESLFGPEDAYQLASQNACDYFNIKLAKSGGIRNAMKIATIAEVSGIKSQVGCFSESRLAITALAHFVLAAKNVVHFDMDAPLMLTDDPILGGIKYGDEGSIHVPDTIGIGVSIPDEYLQKMVCRAIE